jgi:hypothetical protein
MVNRSTRTRYVFSRAADFGRPNYRQRVDDEYDVVLTANPESFEE